MAALSVITVFAGFARSYFLRSLSNEAPLRTVLHVHGALFSTWIVLFLCQAILISRGQAKTHKRLGIAGAALTVGLTLSGIGTAIYNARNAALSATGPDPPTALATSLTAFGVFATLVFAGFVFRRNGELHKRLMLLALFSLLPPALARILGESIFLAAACMLPLAGAVYDLVSRKRIHALYWFAWLFPLVPGPLGSAIGSMGVWRSFARWILQ
jgi:hypothetical protein